MPVVFGGSAFALALAAAAGHGTDRVVPGPDATDHGFAGKFVAVSTTTSGTSRALILKSPAVRRLGARDFLVGEFPPELADLRPGFEGVVLWAPVDEIEGLSVFGDADAARRAVRPSLAAESDAAPRPSHPNQRFAEAVADALQTTGLGGFDIMIEAVRDGGWVRLSGKVSDVASRDRAEEAARRVEGVREVENLLAVEPRPPAVAEKPDA